jgi:hypothetical protein
MPMRLDWKQIGAGLTYGLFGAAGLLLGRDLPMGDAVAMGPGYVPRMVSIGLLGVGGLMVIRGMVRARAKVPLPAFEWRTILLVLGSVTAFAFVLKPLGVVPATALLVAIAAFAGDRPRLRETAALIAVLAVFVVLVFVKGLGVYMHLWPW